MIRQIVLLWVVALLPAAAQTTARRGYIAAYGEASVVVRPDLARLNLGVVTQAPTATEAAARNAEQAAAVIAAIRSVLGQNAEIRTVNYSLAPTWQYPPGGGQPVLTGFSASNIVQATITDLALIGRVLDAGIQAGATRAEGIAFSLRDDEPVRAQALRAAAQRARVKADSIASGLGVRTGVVIAADEGVQSARVASPPDRAAPGAIATPVEPGNYEVRATVTLQLEILP